MPRTPRACARCAPLSEYVIPPAGAAEDHTDARYLVFVALHGIVHAIKQHKPPNEISEAANNEQETEADALAFEWFNAYVKKKNNPYFKPFTKKDTSAVA